MVRLSGKTPDGIQADGCVTTESGLACTIMVADCLPVLLADSRGRAVAAAHAGWRGLAGADGAGVLEQTHARLRLAAGEGGEVMAWLGPCIGPAAFEVGDDVREAFVSADVRAAQHFLARSTPGKFLCDLPAIARQRLARAGVTRVAASGACTYSDATRFYSHRRDRVTGRMAAFVWLAP